MVADNITDHVTQILCTQHAIILLSILVLGDHLRHLHSVLAHPVTPHVRTG